MATYSTFGLYLFDAGYANATYYQSLKKVVLSHFLIIKRNFPLWVFFK